MKRGEIYYIESTYRETGSEQRGGRPAVIVSNDKNNENSEVVEVVYMTTKPKNDLPTHVFIRSALSPSTVLCEQVNSVSVKRIVQQDPDIEKIKLETERDLYRNLYNELLNKTMKGASA